MKKTILRKRQVEIAKDTLKMPDAIAGAMGGMSKKQARRLLKKKFNLIHERG